MEAHCTAAAARLRLAAAAAAAAGAGGLQSSQRKCDRLLWRECNDSKASLFILPARKRSWRETSYGNSCPIPWPDLGALMHPLLIQLLGIMV